MNFSILAFDLDGTALLEDKTLSPRLIDDIKKISSLGIKILPITGRPFTILPESLLEIKKLIDVIVLCNGAEIRKLSDGEILKRHIMPKEFFVEFQKFADDNFFPIYLHTSLGSFITERSMEIDRHYAQTDKRVAMHLERVLLQSVPTIKDIFEITEKENFELLKIDIPMIPTEKKEDVNNFFKDRNISALWTGNNTMEVSSVHATKGTGLQFACDYYGIQISKSFAIGDSGNDMAMLDIAGFGVAMGNASKKIKAIADATTRSNNEDGMALAVEKYVLKQL